MHYWRKKWKTLENGLKDELLVEDYQVLKKRMFFKVIVILKPLLNIDIKTM